MPSLTPDSLSGEIQVSEILHGHPLIHFLRTNSVFSSSWFTKSPLPFSATFLSLISSFSSLSTNLITSPCSKPFSDFPPTQDEDHVSRADLLTPHSISTLPSLSGPQPVDSMFLSHTYCSSQAFPLTIISCSLLQQFSSFLGSGSHYIFLNY